MSAKFYIPQNPVSAIKPQFSPGKPWLAPLAGYSDLTFRILCREYGASVCETEMVSAKGLFCKSPGTVRLLASNEQDQPLVVQLFGSDAEIMGQAVRLLRRHGFNYFDCNMGCSVRKVMRQKAGAALLAEPENALKVAKAMLIAGQEGPGEPALIGFKLRAGISSQQAVLPDLALRLRDAGASWITVHPRFANQGFSGHSDWSMLARLSKELEIPLIASGDLLTAQDGLACLQQTGASAVMYARGALHNPAIFAEHLALWGGEDYIFTKATLRQVIERHMEIAKQYYQPEKIVVIMRNVIPRYIKFFEGVNELRKELAYCATEEQLKDALDRFINLE